MESRPLPHSTKHSRLTLSLIALALCGQAAAQGELMLPPGGSSAGRAPAETPPAARPAEPGGAARIIRGNDRVIATPAPTPALSGPANTFRFEEAPILDVIHVVLRDIMKVDYMVHPPINGAVTMATRGEVSVDEAVYLLENALLANGLVMARDSRGTYHVGRPEALRGIVSAPRQVGVGPLAPGYGAVIIPLEYIGAAEMATILRPLLPPDSLVRVDTTRNLLVLAGNRAQAEGWRSIVSTFDVDLLKGMSVGVFPLKYASVREVEEALRVISGGTPGPQAGAPGAGTAGTAPAAGRPAAPAALGENNPFFGAVRVVPIERLNSILVVTPRAAYLDEARRWIERLDRPSQNLAEQALHVYPVQNGSARNLADVLNGIFGDGEARSGTVQNGVSPGLAAGNLGTPGVTSLPGGTSVLGTGVSVSGLSGGLSGGGSPFGQGANSQGQARATSPTQPLRLGSLRVVADEINNAILVYGTAAEYAKIEAALRRLDLPPAQVLIEASIVEVTLTDELEYGLQWTFNDPLSNGRTGQGILSNLAGGTLGGPLAGFSYTLRNSAGNVRAVLNALGEKSLVKVISNPSLMVLDNHTAQIVVGDQQPIRSSETIITGGAISSSIQYKDTGVALAVTPSVNAGNMVTMAINQAVTDVGGRDDATGQRAFLQRQINSKVAIRSGETLVLGGLIRDNVTNGSSGVPLLSEIPVLGGLFGTKTKSGQRTELLVIITPRVLRSDQDAREVSTELRERMRGLADHPPFGNIVPAPARVPAPLGTSAP